MNIITWLLGVCASVAVLGLVTALGDLLSEEIRARLDAVPQTLLRIAASRLPPELEDENLIGWQADLYEYLRGADAMPVTRLWRGLRCAFGALTSTGAIKRAYRTAGPAIVDEMDVIAGMDSRTDLLTLSPREFESLIRRLFEAIGVKSWVTQAYKDEGVDGVAVNEDPIVGGLCIIQAKRYSKIVGLEAVHALAGVMDHKRAAKGVLITTSWVGKASRDFAAANGRIQIIEGRNLKYLLKEHLGLEVLIGIEKPPPGWEKADLT